MRDILEVWRQKSCFARELTNISSFLELQGTFEENVAQKNNFVYFFNFPKVQQKNYAHLSICELSTWFLIPHGESACTATTKFVYGVRNIPFSLANSVNKYKITVSTAEMLGT